MEIRPRSSGRDTPGSVQVPIGAQLRVACTRSGWLSGVLTKGLWDREPGKPTTDS